ncbi:hypothetical protein JL722_6185 [Aureococcus anophagefferens]|nr:hypothetical protein JL722_6185 [Aureococcus anophagefferens]
MSAPPPPGGYQQPPRGYQQPQQMRAAPQGYAPPGAAPQGGFQAPRAMAPQAPRGYAAPQSAPQARAATRRRSRRRRPRAATRSRSRRRRRGYAGAAGQAAPRRPGYAAPRGAPQTAPQGGFRPPAAPAAPAAPAKPAFQAPKPMAPPGDVTRRAAALAPRLRAARRRAAGAAEDVPGLRADGRRAARAAADGPVRSMSVGGGRRRAAPPPPGGAPKPPQTFQGYSPRAPSSRSRPPRRPARPARRSRRRPPSQQFQGFQPGASRRPARRPARLHRRRPSSSTRRPSATRASCAARWASSRTARGRPPPKVPIGIVCQPMALDTDHEAPLDVVNFGSTGIVRCKKCRAYVNPFVSWVNNGRQWRCNVCGFVNDVPNSYFCQLDPETGERRDKQQRPELCKGSVELVAPGEYMVRPPQPPVFVFVIDVSAGAVATGMLGVVAKTIRASLDGLPGAPRTQVAVITFDASVHFYNLKASLSQPQMVCVPDLSDLFVPLPDDLLVNLAESRSVVEALLDALPAMHSASSPSSRRAGRR